MKKVSNILSNIAGSVGAFILVAIPIALVHSVTWVLTLGNRDKAYQAVDKMFDEFLKG